jgi:hypothetical protein
MITLTAYAHSFPWLALDHHHLSISQNQSITRPVFFSLVKQQQLKQQQQQLKQQQQ